MNKILNVFYRYSTLIFIIILLITLFFGLRVKDFSFFNKASFIRNPNGVHFEKYSISFSDISEAKRNFLTHSFTIHFAFRPSKKAFKNNFQFILMIHNGDDNKQFVVAQWKKWIIIMNGCDYSYARKEPRISFKIDDVLNKILFLTISSNSTGTKLFLNGRLMKEKKSLRLKLPISSNSYLILGNNIYETAPWTGDIFGFCLINKTLSIDEIKASYKSWIEKKSFSIFKKLNPIILYSFKNLSNEFIEDLGSCNCPLNVPVFMPFFKKHMNFFDNNSQDIQQNISDIVINFLGFIPLGFFSAFWLFKNFSFKKEKVNFLVALFFCFFISLFIEVVQMWLPSRCSDISDIIFNVIGGACGILIFHAIKFANIKKTKK